MAPEPFARLEGYELRSQLGSGATGDVYLATQLSTGRDVAVKALAPSLLSVPQLRERFRAEARLMTRFDNENLVNIYDYLEQDGGAYLVMEHVPGVSLRELISSTGRLSPEQALGVLAGALRGLSAAHRLGVVHGDLKPENVVVTPEGVSKLVDFGQASPTGSRPSGGSPAYASPEAVRDETVEPRSDVYGAGLILYELLAGTPPFSGTTAEILAAHRDRAPPALHGVPRAVADLVARSLSKSPNDRPATAEGFLEELEAAAAASYGPDWAARASIAALAGGLLGGAAALGAGGAVRRPFARRVQRYARRARRVALHHPLASAVAAAAVTAGVVVIATSGGVPLASSWHLVSSGVAPGPVSCSGAGHCVALDGQEVLVTGPGSAAQLSPLPSSAGTINAVSCPSERACWAVGSTSTGLGTIIVSYDGGLKWKAEITPSGTKGLTAVSCASESTWCLALGGSVIIATSNGVNWHATTAPSRVGSYGAVSCATASFCVAAAGGTMVTTSNAGASWSTVGPTWPGILFGVSSLDCVSTSVCWTTGNYDTGLPPTSVGFVALSTDGGTSWKGSALPPSTRLYSANDVSCVSAGICLVVGAVNDGGLTGSSGAPVFARTTDAGATWRITPAPPSVVFGPWLDCTGPSLCWLSGKSGVGTTGNGGRSWAPLLLPATVTPGGLWCSTDTSCVLAGAAPFSSYYHTGIGGNQPNAPFVVATTTSGGVLAASADGGKAWHFALTNRHVAGFDGIACWAINSCELAGTITSPNATTAALFDLSGTAVARRAAPPGLTAVTGLSCARQDACWLTGTVDGHLAVERSAGPARWAVVPLPTAVSTVGAISCPASAVCVLSATVASKPALLVTSAASKTLPWSVVTLPSSVSSLGALDCISPTTCWVAGLSSALSAAHTTVTTSVMLRTTSLASSRTAWTSELLPPGLGAATAISCPRPSACLAVAPGLAGSYAVVGAGNFVAALGGSITVPTSPGS